MHFIRSTLCLVLSLLALVASAQTSPNPVAPEPYKLTLAGADYSVLSVDSANGYRVLTPTGRVIGIPAVDATQPLTTVGLATALSTPPAPVFPVPESVTRRQLKEWLIDHNLIDAVEAALNAIPDARQKRLALNWWTESTDFRRDHPLVISLATVLGLSSADIDAAFTAAAQL